MTEPRWLDDTQQLAWQGLLAIINRGLPEIERTLKAHDLLTIQYGILVALADAPEMTLRLSDLANRSNTSQSRLTHRLRDLVARGDIAISDDPNDRRAKNATLTPVGLKRLETVAPIPVEDVQRLIFDQLDPAQTAAFAEALSAIAANLCDHEQFQ